MLDRQEAAAASATLDGALAAYAAEIGVEHLSVVGLIESHRKLRGLTIRRYEERMAELERAREFGYAAGLQQATHGEYVEVAKLRLMTLDELVDFLGAGHE